MPHRTKSDDVQGFLDVKEKGAKVSLYRLVAGWWEKERRGPSAWSQ